MKNFGFVSNPIVDLMDAMCIYMFFDFGSNNYWFIYGCIHKKVYKYWKNRHRVAIEIIRKEMKQNKQTQNKIQKMKKNKKKRRRSISRSENYTSSLESINEDNNTHQIKIDDMDDIVAEIIAERNSNNHKI